MSTYPFPTLSRSPNSTTVDFVSNTDAFQSPLNGAIQTNDRTGERLIISVNCNDLKDADRRKLMSFVSQMNGQANRVSLRDHSYTGPTGNLTSAEMLDVTFNATNWETNTAAVASLSDISGGVRVTAGSTAGSDTLLRPTTSADGITAPTVGYSYAVTMSCGNGRASSYGGSAVGTGLEVRDATSGNVVATTSYVTAAQRLACAYTAHAADEFFVRVIADADASQPGASIDLSNLSISRCLLVDNGFNALTYSEQFDNAAWTKARSSISADAVAAPDGSTSADEFIEDSTASQTHFLRHAYTRSSVSEFWTGSVYLKSNSNQRIVLFVSSDSSAVTDSGYGYFDATLGSVVSNGSQGTASHQYTSIHDCGNGWYRCRVSVKLAATTDAALHVYMCDGATSTVTFNGDGSSSVYLWGAQLQRGGQLGRYTETTTTATTGTAQTGSQIWVKGLDASTNQQLLAGDQVEINGQLCILQSDLDGDESGCGLMEVRPRIRTAPSDEDPVILYHPHGKFLLANPQQSWSNRPGVFSDFTLQFIEDIT